MYRIYTLPETNIAPENGLLEDEFSFWDGLFSGAMLNSGRVYIYTSIQAFPPDSLQFEMSKLSVLFGNSKL